MKKLLLLSLFVTSIYSMENFILKYSNESNNIYLNLNSTVHDLPLAKDLNKLAELTPKNEDLVPLFNKLYQSGFFNKNEATKEEEKKSKQDWKILTPFENASSLKTLEGDNWTIRADVKQYDIQLIESLRPYLKKVKTHRTNILRALFMHGKFTRPSYKYRIND